MDSASATAAAAGKPLTAEEETLRRNTDCVYFLASPLTCKKGIECEFRHSDGARLNPRDCRYWLNGNCLNPKCSFRHPPLDTLYGIPGTPGPGAPALQSAASTQAPGTPTPASYNKQNAPCYYFQKGLCLKGDWCPFTHGPQPAAAIPPAQQVAKASTSTNDPSQRLHALKDPALKERAAQQNALKVDIDRPVEVLHLSINPVTRAEMATNNGQAVVKNLPYQPPKGMHPRSQQTKAPLGSVVDLRRLPNRQSQPVTEWLHNGRNADAELLGVSSHRSEVLLNEDDHGRTLVQCQRNMVLTDDLDHQHPSYERDQSNRMMQYDQHEQLRDQFGRGKRSSTEMIADRANIPEGRLLPRSGRSDDMDGSDLRLRLLKQRRLNGSSTVLNPARRGEPSRRNDPNAEERNHRRDSVRESSIRNRLQGRISVPRRSSPDRPVDIQSERESDRRRPQSRVSPGRPTSLPSRLSERIKQSRDEVWPTDARSSGGKPIQREDADPLNFAGPKSLAELKGAKGSESSRREPTKKLEGHSKLLEKQVGHRESEASLSFDRPKPLSALLKKKRGEASTINRDGNYMERDEGGGNNVNPPPHAKTVYVEEEDEEEEEGQIRAEDDELLDNQDSYKEEDIPEMEDSTVGNENPRNSDNGDVEDSEFEPVEGDDENTTYQNDEDDGDEDDEDDFATKVGLMFS
ncbi:hypothetical protein J5N97_021581 [Dioscorea zingiberensis]|uniref:C3H1-type domain-containing protein n=1 Tax=Dioscorea zingiberensis TaxID=325984 RepID=A0A9D5H9T8_9LILI|nr:hypothetical protein J5N97_021581 [Dioscorea zingiberensis]